MIRLLLLLALFVAPLDDDEIIRRQHVVADPPPGAPVERGLATDANDAVALTSITIPNVTLAEGSLLIVNVAVEVEPGSVPDPPTDVFLSATSLSIVASISIDPIGTTTWILEDTPSVTDDIVITLPNRVHAVVAIAEEVTGTSAPSVPDAPVSAQDTGVGATAVVTGGSTTQSNELLHAQVAVAATGPAAVWQNGFLRSSIGAVSNGIYALQLDVGYKRVTSIVINPEAKTTGNPGTLWVASILGFKGL